MVTCFLHLSCQSSPQLGMDVQATSMPAPSGDAMSMQTDITFKGIEIAMAGKPSPEPISTDQDDPSIPQTFHPHPLKYNKNNSIANTYGNDACCAQRLLLKDGISIDFMCVADGVGSYLNAQEYAHQLVTNLCEDTKLRASTSINLKEIVNDAYQVVQKKP